MSKQHTEEFKKSIVHLYTNGKPEEEITKEYGVSRSSLFRWIRKYREIRLSDDEVLTAEDIRKMQKKIVELEEENLILKKAMAIFTRGDNLE